MQLIYGFKKQDVLALIQEYKQLKKENKIISPSAVIKNYSIKSGLKLGTVRNMYYALAKKSAIDGEFCQEYLDGESIKINKITQFNTDSENKLINDITALKKEGYSVRKATFTLANGDNKLALRYQNKYRSYLAKNTKTNSSDLTREIGNKKINDYTSSIGEVGLKNLKDAINDLVNKISLETKRENDYLKRRLSILEVENAKLKILADDTSLENKKSLLKYFSTYPKKDILN